MRRRLMRFATFVSLSVCGAAMAVAADNAPAAPSTSSEENIISAAKRDLEAIKSSRNPALQTKGADLPQFTVPELQVGNGEPVLLRKDPKKENGLEKKSKNWLVDAVMDKKSDSTSLNARDRKGAAPLQESERLSLDGPNAANNTTAQDGTAASLLATETSANKDNERTPPAPPVVNPLTRFMAGWMTPQDYALLQTNPSGSAAEHGTPSASSSVFLPGTTGAGVSLEAGDGIMGRFESRKNTSEIVTPRDNPYLQGLAVPAPSSSPVYAAPPAPLPPPATTNSAPIFAPSPAPEIAPAKSRIPDFVRPASDDKYFKPLKRF